MFGNVGVDWAKTGDDGRVRKYNAFFTARNAQLLGGDNFPYPFRIKTLLPNYREFDDTRHFYSLRKLASERGVKVETLLQPVHLDLAGRTINLGCLLCEDGWSNDYSVKPLAIMSHNGPVDLFINISSSPYTLGKNNKRNRIFSQQSQQAGVPLIYVNNVGIQNIGKTVYTFDGFSTVYNRSGEIISYCRPFTQTLQYVEFNLATGNDNIPPVTVPDDRGIETIYEALVYGIEHFLASIGLKKVVIGISGL